FKCDWSSDVCSSDLKTLRNGPLNNLTNMPNKRLPGLQKCSVSAVLILCLSICLAILVDLFYPYVHPYLQVFVLFNYIYSFKVVQFQVIHSSTLATTLY